MKAIEKELERPEQKEFYSMYDWLIDQGIEKAKKEDALNLFKLGVSIEIISEATKLSTLQIEQIIQEAGL